MHHLGITEITPPIPIPMTQPGDNSLPLPQIITILDEIDLAHKGRDTTQSEQTSQNIIHVISAVLFPANFALMIRDFIGYMGPANRDQQAFTLSVKRRYNHLARLAIAKGMKRDGYFFFEDTRLTKHNGVDFNRRKPIGDSKSCGFEKTSRSVNGGKATRMYFANKSGETVQVYWLDCVGRRKHYSTLYPGKS